MSSLRRPDILRKCYPLFMLIALLGGCGGTTILMHDDTGYPRFADYRGGDAAHLYLINIDLMPKSPFGIEDTGLSYVQVDSMKTISVGRWTRSAFVLGNGPGPAKLRHTVYSALRLKPGKHGIRVQGKSLRRMGAKNPSYDPNVNEDAYTKIIRKSVPMQPREAWALVA